MTRFTIGLLAATLLAASAPADVAQETVIETAMKAVTGEMTREAAKKKLEKFAAGESKMKGKMTIDGAELPFTGTMTYAVPGKVHMKLEVTVGGQPVTLVQIVNGEKVKQTENGKEVGKISDDATKELMQAALLQEISLLYPLLDPANKFTLKDGKAPADMKAVVVESKGLKPVTLFFDKSGFLTKMTRKGVSPGGTPVDEETTYDDYKDKGGILVDHRAALGGGESAVALRELFADGRVASCNFCACFVR